ncbi:hypothetical protein [Paenibacillus albus]|uniref:Uncharacterized protein n=1 Tax=Paenibacillus albus TaxID=2495582 RepID=A0A3Q8X1T7_9BACL|nr:hypothetical protein [Paenibacillus albus]AZN38506.1 hypothetical protein EJC50_01595 [Paenibacillus albus]
MASLLMAAEALYKQMPALTSMKNRASELHSVVDYSGDLSLFQWIQMTAIALEFKPDLILELGRGKGNSTCMFTEVTHALDNECDVVSICLSNAFEMETKKKLHDTGLANGEWFARMHTYQQDILTFPYEDLFENYNRVLVFWDAHGYSVANCVLGKILPLLERKNHLIMMHDISDTRYVSKVASLYQDILWTGNHFGGRTLQLGHLISSVEQLVAITDFTSRNEVELHTADHSFHTYFAQHPNHFKEISAVLDPTMVSKNAHWVYFSLNGLEREITYPSFDVGKVRSETAGTDIISYEMVHWLMKRQEEGEIAIFGAGLNGGILLDFINNFNLKYDSQIRVSCFYDNYLAGQLVQGIPVMAPDESVARQQIVVASSRFDEIKQQLLSFGAEPNSIIPGMK